MGSIESEIMTGDLFDDLKRLYNIDELQNINKSNLPFLLKFLSNEPSNLPITTQLNKFLWWLDRDIMLYALHFGINKNKRYIHYLKKETIEDEFEWLKPYIQDLYDWSERELKINWEVIKLLLQDKNFKIKIDRQFGFTKEECEKLNIEYIMPLFKKGGLGEWLN
mgnify:CR=1 FL=1